VQTLRTNIIVAIRREYCTDLAKLITGVFPRPGQDNGEALETSNKASVEAIFCETFDPYSDSDINLIHQ